MPNIFLKNHPHITHITGEVDTALLSPDVSFCGRISPENLASFLEARSEAVLSRCDLKCMASSISREEVWMMDADILPILGKAAPRFHAQEWHVAVEHIGMVPEYLQAFSGTLYIHFRYMERFDPGWEGMKLFGSLRKLPLSVIIAVWPAKEWEFLGYITDITTNLMREPYQGEGAPLSLTLTHFLWPAAFYMAAILPTLFPKIQHICLTLFDKDQYSHISSVLSASAPPETPLSSRITLIAATLKNILFKYRHVDIWTHCDEGEELIRKIINIQLETHKQGKTKNKIKLHRIHPSSLDSSEQQEQQQQCLVM